MYIWTVWEIIQERINEIAGDICVENPTFLSEQGKLLEIAKERIHESGFIYSKGKSRSKKFHVDDEERPKRDKIDREECQHRIESLQEQLKDTNNHISVKERRIEQAQVVQNYKLCDQMSVAFIFYFIMVCRLSKVKESCHIS